MNAVEIPTSDAEIAAACPGITTWLYKDLAKRRTLPPLPIAVLYETEPGFGHWVGVLETPEGIEHFDSYGLMPDEELDFVPEYYREAFAENAPHMVRLLLNDPRPVNYSQHKLQGSGRIATCGRWVVARCRNSRLTTDQFARGMRDVAKLNGTTPDGVTTLMMPARADLE
jgi:hypothetical protein